MVLKTFLLVEPSLCLKCRLPSLCNAIAMSRTQLLSAWHVADAAEELNCQFYLIAIDLNLNSYICLTVITYEDRKGKTSYTQSVSPTTHLQHRSFLILDGFSPTHQASNSAEADSSWVSPK